jgi:endo-1,4-beta-xylanase
MKTCSGNIYALTERNFLMKQNRTILLFIAALIAFKGKAQMPDTTLGGFSPFKFGAAISAGLLKSNASYRALVAREFSSITPENALKFGVVHPTQNTYSWADADTIIAFAQQYGKRIHGHTFIWHNNVPTWLANFVGDSAAWENVMKTHIQTVMTRYKGIVKSWDVVNEAVNEDGTMRSTIWSQHLGAGYIARAFQYAHEADTAALLFYNDYNHESSSNSFAKLYTIQNLVNGLVANGIPINGVGMQMHVNKNTNNANIQRALDTMFNTGLIVHISELDVAVNPESNQSLTYNTTIASQQFGKFKFFARLGRNVAADKFYGITTWNVTDGDSWIPTNYSRPDFPLPFSNTYQKKSSYQGFKDGMVHSWNAAAINGQSIAGTYTDLGTNGTAITTNFTGAAMTFDNDNSSVQNIGFDFTFNGTVYTQFVLNTNGYIKLGASAPSSTTVFYPSYNANTGSVTTTSDIDLIYPYNHDLMAGSGTPELRVYTNGTVGSRVCTIQFKNLADKLAPIQYTNMEFQIKLYEATNMVEFVYGTWTASINTPTSITAAVGIKGATVNESVNVAKGSTVTWNTVMSSANNYFFRNGDYPLAGPQFNSRNAFLPDAGRTFRFAASSILPVTLLSFNAYEKNSSIQLQWETVNEINCKDFEVQRSLDGRSFTSIATINAKGNSSSNNNQYATTDYDAAALDVVYYRLKQNEKNGSSAYSSIIRIKRNNKTSFTVSASNPFSNKIDMQLQLSTAQIISIQLVDISGNMIVSKQLSIQQGSTSFSLNVPAIPHGIYFLKVISATEERTIKLLKQ